MRRKICIILILLNLAFIWGNSALPGEVSDAFSRWVAALMGGGQVPSDGGGFLRKLAHFSEFASLGFWLAWHARLRGERGLHLANSAMLGGLLAACVDESIQILTPERASSLVDVWIDTFGVVTGVAALLVIYKLKNNISGGNKQ